MSALSGLQSSVNGLGDLITGQVLPLLQGGGTGAQDAALEAIADQVDTLASEIKAVISPASSSSTAPASSSSTAPASSSSTATASSSSTATASATSQTAASPRAASRRQAPPTAGDGVFRG